VCVTIVATYFLLNAEDYRWHWTSFFAGGSTALYVFIYAVYYFFTKTRMSGFLQTVYYFGYTSLLAFAVSLMFGGISFLTSFAFVRYIYERKYSSTKEYIFFQNFFFLSHEKKVDY